MNRRREPKKIMGTPLFPNWVLLAVPIILTVVVMSFLVENLLLRTLLTVAVAIPFYFLLSAVTVRWMNRRSG